MKQPNTLKQNIDNHIQSFINDNNNIDLFEVSSINESKNTINVKRLNGSVSYNNIATVVIPNVGDVVVGAFLAGSDTLVVIGSLLGNLKNTGGAKTNNDGQYIIKVQGYKVFFSESEPTDVKEGDVWIQVG